MKTFLFWMAATAVAFGQVKYEVQELTGKVISILPGNRFAYEVIEMNVDGENFFFGIDPAFGKSILSRIKLGQELTVKASLNMTLRENLKKNGRDGYSRFYFFFLDKIVEVKYEDQWIPTPRQGNPVYYDLYRENMRVILEEPVVDVYIAEGIKAGLFFNHGRIGTAMGRYQEAIENISKGDKVSFLGSTNKVNDAYWYPVDNISEIYFCAFLKKTEGKIESFIYKQNYVRIGLKVGDLRLSFPAKEGKAVARFANDQPVTIYFLGNEGKAANLLPTIQALVQGRDTLKIPYPYYGDPDGKHEFKPAELEGKISKINRSDKGRIISLIMGNDCYVEVGTEMAEQLGTYLVKGNQLKVTGDERIKKEGEIYEQNYRIITPRKVVADGKEFILND
jgi:hypothetical protein